MNGCTFFGSRDVTESVNLKEVIIDLIENRNVVNFYVGNQGNFDYLVLKVLRELKEKYTYINVSVVLAYMPLNEKEKSFCEKETVYPYELSNTPMKYRIHKRNCWMLDRSEFVVTCVRNVFGGASKFKALALKKGKIVIDV